VYRKIFQIKRKNLVKQEKKRDKSKRYDYNFYRYIDKDLFNWYIEMTKNKQLKLKKLTFFNIFQIQRTEEKTGKKRKKKTY